MPTIQDVARKAGVAPITVSRVVNQSGYISAAIRQRVEAAIAELGYVPNRLAASLRSRRTHTVGLLVTDITNPFFTTLSRGVEDTASQAGLNVILCNTDESVEKEHNYIQVLLEKQVDGILLVPACGSLGTVELVQKQSTPLVVLDRSTGAAVDVVRCDSRPASRTLVQHLLDLGHRRIAVLAGSEEVPTTIDRVAGYRDAMSSAGLGAGEQVVSYGEFTTQSGFAQMEALLTRQPRPTAIFAANNLIAIGAYKAVLTAGLRVPEDIAMVSFDNLPDYLLAAPFFTAAVQPSYAMGKTAMEILNRRILGQAAPPFEDVLLPVGIEIHCSSGATVVLRG